jgi:hypothetical protein
MRRAGLGCGAAIGAFLLVILVRFGAYVAAGGLGAAWSGPPAAPTLSAARVYHDPLTSQGSATHGWANDSHCSAQGDGYHIAGSYLCYAPITDAGDADIAVQVEQIQGDPSAPYGIALRTDGTSDHYEFDIDSHQKWIFYKFVGGSATTLMPFTHNAAIKPGLDVTNALYVRARGSQFDFFVNGVQVGKVEDTTFASGRTGLAGDDGIEVVFTNFSLTRL